MAVDRTTPKTIDPTIHRARIDIPNAKTKTHVIPCAIRQSKTGIRRRSISRVFIGLAKRERRLSEASNLGLCRGHVSTLHPDR